MKAPGLGIWIIRLLALILSRVKESKKHKKATIVYMIITALCFGIAGLTGFLGIINNLNTFFINIQILILILGILHGYFMYRLVPWTSKNKFIWEFLFSFATASLGALLFLLVYNFILHYHALQYVLLAAITWFFVPFFFMQALNRYLLIPGRIFRKWYYPSGKEISDPQDSELVSLLVVSFEFHKKMNDPEITTFRAKAPAHMVFGRLFYYFINDYNERHREGPIAFLDSEDRPYGWVFYKTNWLGRKRYIDPDQIIMDNRVRENSVIICQRIKEF